MKTSSLRKLIRETIKENYEDEFDKGLKTAGGFSDEEFDKITSKDPTEKQGIDKQAEAIWDELLKTFSDNKNTRLEHLNQSYRRYAVMAIMRKLMDFRLP